MSKNKLNIDYRIHAIDQVRGIAILLMALDHVRFFLTDLRFDPMDIEQTNGWLFFSRLITHLCAPLFILLAGMSAGLMLTRRTPGQVRVYLLQRGAWLILLDFVFISTLWNGSATSLPVFGQGIPLYFQVLGAIGVSMMALGILLIVPRPALWALAVGILCLHNLLDPIWPVSSGDADPLWYGLHGYASVQAGAFSIVFYYPVLPWIGVMLLGYLLSPLYSRGDNNRNTKLLVAGSLGLGLFVLLRWFGLYGDPHSRPLSVNTPDWVMHMLTIEKYPPSLHYLLLTLSIGFILLALMSHNNGLFKNLLVTFGRASLFFYLCHWVILRLSVTLLAWFQLGDVAPSMTYPDFFPDGLGIGLALVYFCTLMLILLMWPACRWFERKRAARVVWTKWF
ncbi:DUF1624 domain-containing protein [Lacimicrobium alkaliphilum]|uniref:Heparan-alpha-glucosaminide N-acetyltransferase catalytic domain-containing protein n=1 Tax=Lacimicrobium alkaliphilum TaxID=1526571 RepID=A0A0U2ZE66_9ALTE|nr:heparan-alpha-glucosaminide N-acetyltransferase domain-containing protein [Lacimicrobium alkaliphilum]ALS97415.1 hypothetical protein AT746_03420 [Lacimicrobium alkaliphilum]